MRIRKSTLKRIIAEMVGGRAGPMRVSTDQGGYAGPDGYVTNAQDHSLDQLQDLIDMGVKQVVDSDAGGETFALRDWIPIVVDAARENREDEYKGRPRRWRG